MKVMGIIGLLAAICFGCTQRQDVKPELAWPKADPSVSISESRYTDMGLRVLALELNQEMRGKSQYFLEFLPRMGRIEGRVQLLDINLPKENPNQGHLTGRLKTEISLVEAGVREILGQVSLQEGFDPKSNLEIRFTGIESEAKNLAIYKGGEILWY